MIFKPHLRLLPRRTHWFLVDRRALTNRERRRLSNTPELARYQRAWEAAFPERMNIAIKRVYGGSISSLYPPDPPLLTMLFHNHK